MNSPRTLTAVVAGLIAGCAGRSSPRAAEPGRTMRPPSSVASSTPTASSPPPASPAPGGSAAPDPCSIGAVTSASCAPDTTCPVRRALRIQCAGSGIVAFAPRGPDGAAIVTTGEGTWLTEFGLAGSPHARRVWGARVLRAALASDGVGYRLVAADANSPRLFSLPVDPAREVNESSAEWIESRDARAVTRLLAHRDGRYEAFVVNGSNPGPFRVFTRATDGAWSADAITDQRVGEPIVALNGDDRRVTIASEATARPPYALLRMRIDGRPDVTVAWTGGAPRTGVWAHEASAPVLLVDTPNGGRLLLLDALLRTRTTVPVPSRGEREICIDDPARPGTCHTLTSVDDPALLASGPNGLVWVANVRHHLDLDQSFEEQCFPVDPPGRAPPNWRPPNTCQRRFTLVADRSTAELVVRSLDSRTRTPSLVDRIRVPLVVTARRVQLLFAESDGTLHVLASDAGNPTTAEYIALDEAAIAR